MDLKAQLEITADASGVESGVSRAKKSIASLGQTAAAAGKQASESVAGIGESAAPAVAKVDAATKSLIASIQRTTVALDSGGRSSRQYFELLAQQRGASPEVLRPYLEQLDSVVKKQGEAGTAVLRGATQFNQYGLSAKQTAAALRQVPAQLTDIFVGLQSGQAPLTVLLQQGGQLKDVFGGIRPALSAVGGAVLGLINPFTVAATVVGSLGLAYFKGSKEADEFAKSIILNGNAVGATAGQLQQIAVAVSGVVGTQGKAAEVVAQLAASGRVTRDSLQSVAIAAIKLERDAGKAIGETVKEFAELGKDPVKASERLNEKYNFLTLSVYEQIRALQEQGREVEAVSLAQKELANTFTARADEIERGLGALQLAWRAVAREAKGFWDAALDVGRAETPESRLVSLQARLSSLNATPELSPEFGGGGNGDLRAQLEAEIRTLEASTKASADAAAAEADRIKVQQAGIAASKEIERIREASRTNQQKLNAELKSYRDNLDAIRKANPDSILLDPARIKADEQAIRARFKTAAPAARDDAAVRMLQSLREAESVSRAQLTVDKELTASEQKKAEFVQLIADLKEKRVLAADQKSLLAAQEAIKAQLDRNIAVEREVKARADATKEIEKQQRALEQFQDRAAQLAQSIRTANANRADQNADRLSAFGRGDAAREQLQAQISIQREFQREQERLDRDAAKSGALGSDAYKAATANIREQLGVAQVLNRQYYADLAVAQSDWANGASRAFENYLGDARNVAGQVEDLLGNAFTGLEDALVEFTMTGKLSFSDLANTAVAEINRIIIRQQLIKPFEELLAGAQSGEGLGGLLSKGLSGLFGGSLKVPGFGGGQIDPAQVAADTAKVTSATALATAETAAAAAIATASASSSLALGTLTTAAASAARSLALVSANSGGGGGDILGTFISALGVSGGRANGGPVSAGSAYRINERGAPEIATLGGKDYLLTGSQGGRVTPATGGQQRSLSVVNHFAITGLVDRSTQEQIARRAGIAIQQALARGTA